MKGTKQEILKLSCFPTHVKRQMLCEEIMQRDIYIYIFKLTIAV